MKYHIIEDVLILLVGIFVGMAIVQSANSDKQVKITCEDGYYRVVNNFGSTGPFVKGDDDLQIMCGK